MSAPLFSIIIPNWNGAIHLPTCLMALRAQTHAPLEVIVVDNASTDGSQALIRAEFPEVRLIELTANRGFTGACNAGLQAANGAFLALLNNDTEADPHWAAEVLACFARHPEAGIVASKMLLFDQRDVFHTAGDLYTLDGRAVNRGVWQRDRGQFEREEYVFSACGGSAAYRRAMLEQIGLLDDDFFFSMEDVDLAWRAQLADWRCVYTPKAVVYHKLSATGGGVTASFYDGRNALWVIAKNYPKSLWRKHWRRVLAAQWQTAWQALRAWRGAAARAKLRGMAAGLVGLPRMLKKRRLIQARRRISDSALEAMLTDAIA
ncbi:MAG: glycosyltransferase family 2 protein [Candidatus Thermofonsia Clade 1 bacterium]|jgi:GT2 family glycosyltransferase|uniref:Glycosyltransferase family 2 protein n=1 Tax=Candidatus Thermofonsia Clade 1 bacterium TaxID=2364210 RepID=A0A2M8PAG1_9CHLR|nr:MAG: glycosyltransferase family 2 protein [Candidatus Thermofonsia Clade 1 bacterium]PJF42924.1 MAG: glycosyltransferase family 2 protein [Candidatus Thermofonsia Clade 1 bacterium]